MLKFLIFVLPLVALGSTFVPSNKEDVGRVKRGWEDQVAEDLQKQIDKLRKDLQEVKKNLGTATSNEKIAELHKEFDDIKRRLEDSYLKIDQLAQGIRQEYRQKIDAIHKELTSLQDSLTDRVKSLEDHVQRLTILQTIGSIQDGNINLAAKTFQAVKYPELVIPRIVQESYNGSSQEKDKFCKNIVAFSTKIQDKSDRPQALDLLLTEVQKANEVFEMSDCVFKIAFETKGLLDEIRYGDPLGYLWSIRRQLPSAVHLLNTFSGFIYVTKESKECNFKSDDERNRYIMAGHLGEFNKWQVQSQDTGEYYRFEDRESKNLLEADGNGRVYFGSPYNNGPKQQWKPTLVSNEQISLKNRETGKYLSFEKVGTCYKYSLSDKSTPVYIRM